MLSENVHGPPRKASTSRPAGRPGPSFSSRCMIDEIEKNFFPKIFSGKKFGKKSVSPAGRDPAFCVASRQNHDAFMVVNGFTSSALSGSPL